MNLQAKHTDSDLLSKTFDFAVNIINYTGELQEQNKFVIGNQLLKCGTAIGANTKESENAETEAVFISKLETAIKEATETQHWLSFCNTRKDYPKCNDLLNELAEIINILNKTIATTK
ncbi:four helix bundle protein [Flavobacterium sp. ANB]|jgi:four helix bundle protein|uniref:four helix bundle protein n=1 Tax=unclassified Flavobacterium TaxID=196869 RepID=UPI0012B94870|nr:MULTISPECIES: four helix bundle protein [unclassified Flavobacterium]MBF4517262.1 four helix bundle protein [Flavobacterium sp. ANB]MTD70639.1 four helix bundle protein [Flavobacterium sp. LC2016-13]